MRRSTSLKLMGAAFMSFCCLMLVAAQTTNSAQQSAEWKTVIGPDRSFTAEMPVVSEHSEQQLKTPAGTAYTFHSYSVNLGNNTAYVVQTAVYPTDVDVSDPKNNLQAALEGGAKSLKDGKWTSVSWVERQGLMGVEGSGSIGELEVRSYFVMKGSRMFILIYGGPPGTAKSPDFDRFLNSLQISK